MTTITFDTLKYANHLKLAGVESTQAEAQAEALSEVMEVSLNELVTKADLLAVKTELKTDIQLLKSEIKADMQLLEQRMVIKLGGLMVIAVGVVAALVKLL